MNLKYGGVRYDTGDDDNHADFCIAVLRYVPSLSNPNLLYHSPKSPTMTS